MADNVVQIFCILTVLIVLVLSITEKTYNLKYVHVLVPISSGCHNKTPQMAWFNNIHLFLTVPKAGESSTKVLKGSAPSEALFLASHPSCHILTC